MTVSRIGSTLTAGENAPQNEETVFGHNIAGIGDYNNDSYDDFAVTATATSLHGGNVSEIHIIYGQAGGYDLEINLARDDAPAGLTIRHENNRADYLAFANTELAAAGDFNGDGFDDFIVSSERFGVLSGDGETGRAWLVLGGASRPDEIVLSDTQSHPSIIELTPSLNGARTGADVASAGDVDGDGFDDLLVSAPGSTYGEVYLVYGRATVPDSLALDNTTDGVSTLVALETGTRFGTAVAGIGDINNDGFDDFAIGETGADYQRVVQGFRVTHTDAGRVHILLGHQTRDFDGTVTLVEDRYHAILEGLDWSDNFGAQITGNGSHLAIAAPGGNLNVDGRSRNGTIYLFDLETLLTSKQPYDFILGDASQYVTKHTYDNFGSKISLLGENALIATNSGLSDYVVIVEEARAGTVGAATDLAPPGTAYELNFGGVFDVASLGDIDRSGTEDFAISLSTYHEGTEDSDNFNGQMVLFFGATPGASIDEELSSLLHTADLADGTEDYVIDPQAAWGLETDLPAVETAQIDAPDFAVADVLVSQEDTASPNQRSIQFTLSNAGTAAGLTAVSLYLSNHEGVSAADTRLGTYTLDTPLTPGAVLSGSLEVTLPDDLLSDDYYVAAIADIENTIDEVDEANNRAVSDPIPYQSDLKISNFQVTGDPVAGDTLTVSYELQNLGPASEENARVGILLSKDNILSWSDDSNLNFVAWTEPLAAGATESVTTVVSLPSNLDGGNYFLAVSADPENIVSETRETNNTVARELEVEPAPRPDLIMNKVLVTQRKYEGYVSGGPVVLNYDISNKGDADTEFAITFFLSDDHIPSSDDTKIFEHYFSKPFAASDTKTGSFGSALPEGLTSGSYYVWAELTPTQGVPDSDDSNNANAPGTLSHVLIKQPDFVISDAVLNGTGVVGLPLELGFDLDNYGFWSGPVDVSVYLSSNSVVTTSDPVLWTGEVEAPSLGTLRVNPDIVIPENQVPGGYHLGIIADPHDNLPEDDETNNSIQPISLTIERRPDFSPHISSIQTSPTSYTSFADGVLPEGTHALMPGETIKLAYTISNIGDIAAAPRYATFYLSTVVDGSENLVELGQDDMRIEIPAHSYRVGYIELDIPEDIDPDITYYFLLSADNGNVTDERDETNNISTAEIPSAEAADLDIAFTFLDSVDGRYELGTDDLTGLAWKENDSITVGYTVTNTGDFTAVASQGSIGFENSALGIIHNEGFDIPELAAGESRNFVHSLTVPSASELSPGTIFDVVVLADVNNVVGETILHNNVASIETKVSKLAELDVIPETLVLANGSRVNMTNGTHDTAVFERGQSYDLEVGLRNLGERSVFVGDIQVDLIHTDDQGTQTTTRVGTVSAQASFSKDATGYLDSWTVPIALPENMPVGQLELVASVDTHTNLSAPAVSQSVPFNVAGPDIEAREVGLLDRALVVGTPMTISPTFANVGSEDLAEGATYSVYLSTDNFQSDAGTLVASGMLGNTSADSNSSTVHMTTQLPSGLSLGRYYLRVAYDPSNIISELSESNNVAETDNWFDLVLPISDQVSDGDDIILGGHGDSMINAGAGDDTVNSGTGSDIVTLGSGADRIVGRLSELLGDTVTDFQEEDSIEVTDVDLPRSEIDIRVGSAILGIDADADGQEDGTIYLEGDFSSGDFMAVAEGANTVVTFETFLPTLQEGQALDPSVVNGIINQNFLKGDGSSDFKVTLREMGQSAYNNVVGVYEVDEGGNIIDTRILFENANAEKSGVTGITDVEAGNRLGFFIVQNAAKWAAKLADNDTLSLVNGSGAAANISDGHDISLAVNGAAVDEMVFHSFSEDLNSDGVQHALSGVDVGGESISIGFEDLTGGGDLDYQDVILRLEIVDDFIFV